MKSHTLRFSKPVCLTGDWNYGHPELRAEQHRAIKARLQAIRRELKRIPAPEERTRLDHELKELSDLETAMFRIRHRTTNLPLDKRGRPYVPRTARGKRHVPVSALPLNERRKRHVPSARDIVEEAVFRKFAEKGNIATAYAKLAAINPEKYGEFVRDQAKTNPRVQRARNRVGSDVSTGWPPTPDELLVLENFYATEIFRRPLFGMAYDLAAQMLGEKSATMTVDRYRRILRKFFLSSPEIRPYSTTKQRDICSKNGSRFAKSVGNSARSER